MSQSPYCGKFAAAAMFYQDVLTDDPVNQGRHRSKAAQVAAKAAAGKGKDAPMDDIARSKWRKLCLHSLRVELALLRDYASRGEVSQRRLVREQLARWPSDPDLASVRDEKSLAGLPAAERREWHKLWADVAALLKKVQDKL